MDRTELRDSDPAPAENGALVVDTKTNKIGYAMGNEGPHVQLRPPGGGREWDAAPNEVRHATDTEVLRARVTELNRAGRLG
ncbi:MULTISPECIES: hypothetical protein [unclassified Streptomyces]|uniref:hypothetical protein n=1 Tax=unclassified Streptomyces TaxID=2593676 RepID=UPI00236733CD|nr:MULTISPECIES: hypothetical protein [unclassified Streptomyces]MDF3140374.1 hypothetical protein [Streptomyces sp. T21Q-yed]WDF39467.1 hypothetical protein PBV52_23010 [Streptomyces sp. T12]